MPNSNKNNDFEPGNLSADEENLSISDFSKDDEETDSEEDEDFDLDEDVDTEIKAPVFDAAAGDASLISSDDEEDEVESDEEEDSEDEELSNDEDEEENEEAEENDLEPILADAVAAEKEFEEDPKGEDEEDEYGEEDEKENSGDNSVIVSKTKIILAKQLMENVRKNSARLSDLFGGLLDNGDEERISIAEISDGLIEADEESGKVVEGIFNGENMIGPDGKEYSVPANYASKSKLVEGDILKLTITDRGTFVYKQTKPVERKRLIGKLEKDANGNYLVKAERKKFRVITASITYYKGVPGDQVVILVPVAGDSLWAAAENVIKSK